MVCPPGFLTWEGGDAPLNCLGEPEPTLTFLVEDALYRLLGWVSCATEEDPDCLSPVYNRPPFVLRTTLPWAPRSCIPMPPDPPVGSVALVRVSSYNVDGVRDDAPCP